MGRLLRHRPGRANAGGRRFICRFRPARIEPLQPDHAEVVAGTAQPYSWEEIAMSLEAIQVASRRKFLQFLAASPLFAATDLAAFASERPGLLPDPMLWAARGLDKLI